MGKEFRFLHIADTHLGYSGNASRYNEYSSLRIDKTTEEGLNVRLDDLNKAFSACIDLAIEQKVDAVLHAGDMFDFWGYRQPIVYNFAQKEILRLGEHNIPFIAIIGNHDLPKTIGKGCYLESLGRLPNVHVAYKGIYEQISLPEHNVVIHCLPSTFSQDMLDEAVDETAPVEGKLNIGMGHFGVTSIKHYAENAINSLVVSLDRLISCNMDYFCLGDYHEAVDFGYNIRYCGSTERMGFGELQNTPQALLVAIDEDSKATRVEEFPLPVRAMIELAPLDVQNKSIEEINAQLQQRISSTDLEGKIIRFRVRNLPSHLKKMIDIETVKELTSDALHFKLELIDKMNIAEQLQSKGTEFEGVLEGWHAFVEMLSDEDASFDKERLKQEGYERLASSVEDTNTTI